MSFANPWGLLGLLAVPVILAVHFFHRRFPPLVIAGAHLWGIESEVQTVGRRWDRLPLSRSLLFELLAAILLSLLLSQPRLGILGTATHLVVVLDHSASMLAGAPNDLSFRDKAVEELRKRVEELPRGSRVTVLLSGPLPQTLAGPAVTWQDAERMLEGWQPGLPAHQFQPAWDRAVQFAGNSGQMLFLTDRLPSEDDQVPEAIEVVAVGEPLRNLAITTAEWERESTTETTRLYIRIANFNTSATQVEIEVRSEEEKLANRSVTVAAGEEIPAEFSLPTGHPQITVELLSAADGLALDNRVVLREPQPRPVSVSLEFPEGSTNYKSVESVLRLLPGVSITQENPQLRIAPAQPLPPSEPGLWWFGIGPMDPSEPAREAAIDVRGPYILEQRNPIVQGLNPGTLIWGGVQDMPDRVAPLISCDRSILLGKLQNTFTTGYLLNIDLDRSQLTKAEDWPILLSNLIELRRENLPGLKRWNYRLNERIPFRSPKLTDPDGRRLEWKVRGEGQEIALAIGRQNSVEVPGLNQPGVYELRAGERIYDRFAVNFFDGEESNLQALSAGTIEQETDTTELFQLDNPYSWLILLGIALVLLLVVADWNAAE